jgi:nitrite reductase/ring-hydroxylating ferredoxin subunit
MPLAHVGKVSGLPPGSVMECMVGEAPYAVCNVGGAIRALSGICLHSGGPLGQGQIHDGRVVCPYHLWEFDCITGEYDYDSTRRVATYAVKVEGDDILIEVPERA